MTDTTLISRRRLLTRLGLAAGAAYVAPVMLHLNPARASGASGGSSGGASGGASGASGASNASAASNASTASGVSNASGASVPSRVDGTDPLLLLPLPQGI